MTRPAREKLLRRATRLAREVGRRAGARAGLVFVSGSLVACGGGPTSSSDPSNQPNPWAGHTYFLNAGVKDWVSPDGVGYDLDGIAPAFVLSVGQDDQVTLGTAAGTMPSDSDPDVEIMVPADQAVQDLCSPTAKLSLDGAEQGNGIGPASVRMHFANDLASPALQVTGDVFDLTLTDVLPTGDATSSGTLEATMDLRQLYVLFSALGPTRTAESICTAYGIEYTPAGCTEPGCMALCQPCPDDGAPYCLTVKAEGVTAVEAPNLSLTEVDENSRPTSCADSTL